MKKNNIVEKISTSSRAAKPGAGLEVEVLGSAVKKHCFIRDTFFSDLENEYEFEPGFVLKEKLNLDLASPPYNTRRARAQSGSAHGVFLKKDTETAVRLMGSVMAFRAHGHIVCSDLMFFHWHRSLRAAKKKGENVEEDLKGSKEKASEATEVEEQVHLYIERPGVYSREPRR